MVIGVLFAILAALCGVGVTRACRAPLSLAPVSGLAAIAVLTTWCARLDLPPLVSTLSVVGMAIAGLAVTGCALRVARSAFASAVRKDLVTTLLLVAAMVIPAVLLGVAMASVDAPVSTHDGAFHVETIESMRQGVPIQGWYPMGFHASVAAALRLVPWLDTALGTTDAAQALAILAPLAIFSLGLAIGLSPRLA